MEDDADGLKRELAEITRDLAGWTEQPDLPPDQLDAIRLRLQRLEAAISASAAAAQPPLAELQSQLAALESDLAQAQQKTAGEWDAERTAVEQRLDALTPAWDTVDLRERLGAWEIETQGQRAHIAATLAQQAEWESRRSAASDQDRELADRETVARAGLEEIEKLAGLGDLRKQALEICLRVADALSVLKAKLPRGDGD